MNHTPEMNGNLQMALDARAKGLVAIPCHPGMKYPVTKWKQWQTEMPPLELQKSWFQDARLNIAIITTGLVVFDCDDPAKAELVLKHCGETPHVIRTPRGGLHLGYRKRNGVGLHNTVKVKGMAIDIRTDGGLEIIPPSETAKGKYEWLGDGLHAISELPVAKIAWTRDRVRKKAKTSVFEPLVPIANADDPAMIFRATRYMEKVDGAVAGQNGHGRTMWVASVLVQKFNLSPEQALPIIWKWNVERCKPPWDENAILHKLRDAEKNRQKFSNHF